VRFLKAPAACAAILGYVCMAHTRAEGLSSPPLTLRDAIQTALLHNRTLQIERINPEVERANLSASWGFYDPLLTTQAREENVSDSGAFDPANPAVDTGFDSKSYVANVGLTGFLPSGLTYNLSGSYGHSTGSRNFLNFDSYRVVAGIYLQQPLLKNMWIDLPRLTIRVNRRNLKISEDGVRFTAMTILNQVQQGYYDLVLAWENLRVQEDLLATRERFLRGIQRQVEVGTLTVLDERVAESQRAKVQTDLIAASNTVALAGNNLKALMGVGGTNWSQDFLAPADRTMVVGESFELGASWQRGLAQRPDLHQLAKGLENADLNLKFRRNQLFPAVDIIGSYGRRGASSMQAFPPDEPSASAGDALNELERGVSPNDMIGLVFTMPLSRTADRANFRAGKELKKQAELLVKQKEEMVVREISDAIHLARFSLDRARSARRTTEYAEAALRAEEEKLAGGKSSIIFVLAFQEDLATAQATELQAKSDYNKAVSQVHFAEGSILQRNKVEFEFR